ncbi:hypothetical protein KAT63_01785 [Candidatus Parcubacteria bacterium]|nr:hypothetical protein [Candidatus Parcubacteria bacterium]
MRVKLTARGEQMARELQLPILARDGFYEVMDPEKAESEEIQKLKEEIVILIKENKFYGAMMKIIEAIGIIEDDPKGLIMIEREMEIRIP